MPGRQRLGVEHLQLFAAKFRAGSRRLADQPPGSCEAGFIVLLLVSVYNIPFLFRVGDCIYWVSF